MDVNVTVSERAARRIGEILKSEPAGSMLRVSVEGGGCSGFQYKFGVERAKADDDIVIARAGAVVLIDPVSVNYMAGSEIDFVDDLIGASFKVKNPKATASCGCGTSFALSLSFDPAIHQISPHAARGLLRRHRGLARSPTSSSCGSSRRLIMRSKRSR